jgi:hypothetical protein
MNRMHPLSGTFELLVSPHCTSNQSIAQLSITMSSLPPTLDFAAAEEEICKKWAEEETFKTQDKLSLERGDEVSAGCVIVCG